MKQYTPPQVSPDTDLNSNSLNLKMKKDRSKRTKYLLASTMMETMGSSNKTKTSIKKNGGSWPREQVWRRNWSVNTRIATSKLKLKDEPSFDLCTKILTASNVCYDQQFVEFIQDLPTENEMGTQPIPSRVLMSQAEKKYTILVTTKRWKVSTATEEKLPPMQSCLISPQQKLDANKGTSKKRKQEEDSKDKGRRKGQEEKARTKSHTSSRSTNFRKMHEIKNWNNIDWHYCCDKTDG